MTAKQWAAALPLLLLLAAPGRADDVDIYLSGYQADSGGGQPQVMLIVDNSYSMGANRVSGTDQMRMAVAKEVVSGLVRRHPGINFSMAVFNKNNWPCRFSSVNPDYADCGNNGGRIVQGLPPRPRQSTEQRDSILRTIDAIRPDPTTPLCETMSEVYRYFTGERVTYGSERHPDDRPVRDTSIESDGRYLSPLRPCESVYVIYMTDGFPLQDTQANGFVEALTGERCELYWAAVPPGSNTLRGVKNCLPNLTRYMAQKDLAPDLEGSQHAYTFTIGFDLDNSDFDRRLPFPRSERSGYDALLRDAAQPPGGSDQGYYTADDREQLNVVFNRILGRIIENESPTRRFSTATSAAGTENLGRVYSPSFQPREYDPWVGNLRKFVTGDSASVSLANSDLWSDIADHQAGGSVMRGGAGARLLAQVSDDDGNFTPQRTLYTDIAAAAGNGALPALVNLDKVSRSSEAVASNGKSKVSLQSAIRAANPDAAATLESTDHSWEQLAQWLEGRAITEGNDGGVREWIMGDIVHARPLVINYGCAASATTCSESDQRLRVLAATNEGVLHAIDGADGKEAWAFWPQESAGMAVYRMLNTRPLYPWPDAEGGIRGIQQSTHYGIDASPAAWLDYSEKVDDEGHRRHVLAEAVVAFGFRRGGRGYYGLDISDYRATPRFWRAAAGGGNRWGQSWSTPVAARLDSYAQPVFMFGGGYDIAYDGEGAPAADAVYGASFNVLNVRDGRPVARLTHSALVDSVAADVTAVDRDFDGAVDGAFFADLGGNLWWADLAGSVSSWHLVPVATLGRHGDGGDRRFFNRANLVRALIDRQPVDLLMIGSGDRTRPQESAPKGEVFYVLEVSGWLDGAARPPIALTNSQLQRVTISQDGAELDVPLSGEVGSQRFDRDSFNGWRIELPTGEKVLSDASTVGGSTLFSVYRPADTISMCAPAPGSSWLYGFRLPRWSVDAKGKRQLVSRVARSKQKLGDYIVDTPSLLVRDQRTHVLGGETIGAVNEVLGTTGDADSGDCGAYDDATNSFGNCLFSLPAWWYQQP